MQIKYNINKIHSDLLTNFEVVKLEEKSNLKFGNYFEISSISEGIELKMILTKKDLDSSLIKWSYFDNPLDQNSNLVERNSSIDNILNDVKDVVFKKRFSIDYLNSFNK